MIFHKQLTYVLALSIIITLSFFPNFLTAQKTKPQNNLEFSTVENLDNSYIQKEKSRISNTTKLPIALYGIAFQGNKNLSATDVAKSYLSENHSIFGLKNKDLTDLKLHFLRETNAGSVVRFRQYHLGLPVNKAELTVNVDLNNKVQFVMNSYIPSVKLENVIPSISEEDAKQIATDYINPKRYMHDTRVELFIHNENNKSTLTYKIIILAGEPQGEWHVLVNAQNGEIFKVSNELLYYCDHNNPKKSKNESCTSHHKNCSSKKSSPNMAIVDGSGLIFNPDPLSSNQATYGGNFSDNDDATNVDLDNSRFSVVLREIEETNGVYKLSGPWAEVVENDAPSTGLFTQNSPDFNFNRNDQAFEAVNCYYHIDSMMRYINVTLGCDISPLEYTTGVRYDPHGANGADQSFYSPASNELTFGEGCVDDGEDSDVIHHELGHGLHDWVTGGNLSQVDGLSEGCGDYIAQSYNRSLGYWSPSDPAYNWVFIWDGHSDECWPGRVTNYNVGYPGGLTGSIHTNGQIWASCLMNVWDEIGRERMDKIFYEGLGMTNGNSSQNDAANAIYQAALNLNYTSAEITSIHDELSACGYTLPMLPSDPNDAGIEVVVSPSTQQCTATITPVVRLRNYGSNDLTSVDISYNIDGGMNQTFAWTGNISAGSTLDVSLPSTLAFGGTHTFEVSTVSPNGVTDSDPTNDSKSNSFNVVLNGESIDLIIVTDNYGSETTWTIVDGDGNTVSSGGPYGNNTTYSEIICLSEGCYDFTISDSYGDGICCEFGTGSYQIDNLVSGQNYVTGGEFGTSETTNFCINPMCSTDLNLTGNASTSLHNASNSINSDGTISIGKYVIYQAGNFIELNVDFEVESDADFLGEIAPCPTVFAPENEENK